MIQIFKREAIYLWYYFDIQFRQIAPYYVVGILIGSLVSVFAKKWIHNKVERASEKLPWLVGIIFASALGIASPLCMYGTIPIAAAFSRKGVKDDFLASFMMSSVLLNPQLIIYSTALGFSLLIVRLASCFICGILAGLLVRHFFENRKIAYFDFSSFDNSSPCDRDTDSNIFFRLLKNIGRNIKATALWFLLGITLSALFQRYVPESFMTKIFGKENEGFGILMAATVGVPLYVCGGGTIPLILQWLSNGMSAGSATAFMITGPATKITNLGALKIALGAKHFSLYIAFVILFSLVTGYIVNIFL